MTDKKFEIPSFVGTIRKTNFTQKNRNYRLTQRTL